MNAEYEITRVLKRNTNTESSFPNVLCDIRNKENGNKMFGITVVYFSKEEVISCKEGDIIYL